LAPEWLLVLPNVEKFTDWNEGIKILPPLEQVQTVMKNRGLSCVYMSEPSLLKNATTMELDVLGQRSIKDDHSYFSEKFSLPFLIAASFGLPNLSYS
jgi:hypothetical protein